MVEGEKKCTICGGESLFIGGNWCCQNDNCRQDESYPDDSYVKAIVEDLLALVERESLFVSAISPFAIRKKIRSSIKDVYNDGHCDGYHCRQDEIIKIYNEAKKALTESTRRQR